MATNTTTADWPTTMRAWTYANGSGGLEKALKLEPTAAAPPSSLLTPDAVLVQVHYMTVNPADYKLAELGVLARGLVSPPASPGMDYAGRVVQAGANAAKLYSAGQFVFGRIAPNKYGTLAEYIVVKDGEGLAHVPEGGDLAQYGAIGTCGLTALQSIKPYVPATPGEGDAAAKVFINGGSGGTGTYGIQIAKALGCHVTVSCSGSNAEFCKSLGADEVIDYREKDVSQELKSKGQVFTLVVDNVGYSPAKQEDLYVAANKFLKDDGHFIQIGGGASKEMIKAMAKRAVLPAFLGGGKRTFKAIMTTQSHADLETLATWFKDGKVKSVIEEAPVPFDEAPKAYEKLKTGRTKGKIVVQVQA